MSNNSRSELQNCGYWPIFVFFLIKVPSSSTSENAIGDPYKTHIPSAALSLNSLHNVRYYSKVTPSYDATAVTNQNISIHLPSAVSPVSKLLPQHCTSGLGQTCTTHPNCLVSFQGSMDQIGPFHSSQQKPLTCILLLRLWLEDWDLRAWFWVSLTCWVKRRCSRPCSPSPCCRAGVSYLEPLKLDETVLVWQWQVESDLP